MRKQRYRVMLIDDDFIFVEDLFDEINRAGRRFDVAAQLSSPTQALEAYASDPCDVVFTDIQMPGMDGIELASALQKINPSVIVVFLTGYGKIEYAQRAIRVGGYDFLLKPLKQDELVQMLGNIERQCDQLWESRITRRLNACLAGNAAPDLVLDDAGLAFAAASFGQYNLLASAAQAQERASQAAHNGSRELKRILGGQEDGFVWVSEVAQMDTVCVALDRDMTTAEWSAVYDALQAACRPGSVTFVYSDKRRPGGAWFDTLQALKRAAHAGKLFAASSLKCVEDIEAILIERRFDTSFSALAKALRERDDRVCLRVWEGISESLERDVPYVSEMEDFLHRLIGLLDSSIEEAEERETCIGEIIASVYTADDIKVCLDNLRNIIMAHMGMMDTERSRGMLAKDIENYLRRHISDDITMDDIARDFLYNPSYIHRVFKKSYGKTPMKYLNDIRMLQAIRLLEENPAMRIQDVAHMVGIRDQYYFSRVFKRYTGKTPGEYQTEHANQHGNT